MSSVINLFLDIRAMYFTISLLATSIPGILSAFAGDATGVANSIAAIIIIPFGGLMLLSNLI